MLNPKNLKKIIQMKFHPYLQHDSHEFLMHLIGELQDEETPKNLPKFDGDHNQNPNRTMQEVYEDYFTSNPSIIDKLFTGISRSVVRCGSCGYESIMLKPISAISLHLSSNIDKSLKSFFAVCQFDSKNMYKCEKCDKKTKAKFYTEMCHLPEVLVFHMKRFELTGSKKSGVCEYRRQIDM